MKTKHVEYNIFEVLKNISQNKIILPSIQRDFVWTKQQVVALFDSIMLGYPISTFLFWNIEEFDFSQNTYFYQFLKEISFNFQGKAGQVSSSLIDSNILENNTIAVLDGQQRLTSLYVALLGQIKTKAKYKKASRSLTPLELYLDLSSGTDFFDDEELIEDEFDDAIKDNISYTFNFQLLTSNPDKKKWFKVKEILRLKERANREQEINSILSGIDSNIKDTARNNLNLLAKRIFDEVIINVSELSQCELDEALEIFIRFNRGGTQLSKSDLVFSTIESRWPEAKDKVEKYLLNLNNNVFQSRDGGEYHQDHIHASVLFDNDNNQPYGVSDTDWIRWGKMKNKLPNLQLLKGKPNQSKSKKQLENWLDSSDAPTESEFRNALNLPADLSLKLKDFEMFFCCRKENLKTQLKRMLI